jgi:peptide/nickel transport system permease protein
MTRYLLRRLAAFLPTLFAVALVVFFMIELVPGDPVGLILGLDATEDAMEALRQQLGLDRPLLERLVDWFGGAFQGDLGESLFLHEPVMAIIIERYPVTISMTILSLFVAIMVGIPAGIIAAINQGRLADWVAMMLALVVLSVPSFWLALNLIYFFGVKLRWLPIGGYVPLGEDPREFLRHMILPCISLGLAYAAMIARITRTSMLEVLRMDYMRTAEAKGLSQRVVILSHGLKNAFIPVITVIGLGLGALLGGSAVTETVYNLPGVGRMIVEAVKRRDYFLVQGGILAITATYLAINLLVDLFYVWIDPRIRYDD